MTPRQRCYAGQQFLRYEDPLTANVINSPAEIDRVPQDYGINNKVEARCSVSHSLGHPVTEFAKLVKKNCAGKSMTAFALVEDGM